MHYGLQDDRKPIDYQNAYGKGTLQSELLGNVLQAQNLNGLADKFNDIKEGHY